MKRAVFLTFACLLAFGAEARAPQHEGKRRYRFTAYWKLKNVEGKQDCYGEMRIDSALQWQIPASQAGKWRRRKDETISVTFGTAKRSYYEAEMNWNGTATVTAFLKSRGGKSGDTTLCSFTLPLSPQIAAGQGERAVGQGGKAELRYRLSEVSQ